MGSPEYNKREDLKEEGWKLIHESEIPEERFRGAVQVIQQWYERSLDAHIIDKHKGEHTNFEIYAAIVVHSDRGGFPEDVQSELERRYMSFLPPVGEIPPRMLNGGSYWVP